MVNWAWKWSWILSCCRSWCWQLPGECFCSRVPESVRRVSWERSIAPRIRVSGDFPEPRVRSARGSLPLSRPLSPWWDPCCCRFPREEVGGFSERRIEALGSPLDSPPPSRRASRNKIQAHGSICGTPRCAPPETPWPLVSQLSLQKSRLSGTTRMTLRS